MVVEDTWNVFDSDQKKNKQNTNKLHGENSRNEPFRCIIVEIREEKNHRR